MWIRRLAVFLGALILYIICLDRGASLWDCPEYILIAWRLEIGHPPGNPTWQLIANVVSHLGGSAQHAAVIINSMSAVAMALAATFLSEIIFLLLRGSLLRGARRERRIWAGICGACGALCYAWCDSAIFSAVEAEVYALSAMFTSLMLLLSLLWARRRARGDIAGSRRMIILCAYLAGLGVGVHELNFLILPAMALVFWYGARRYPMPRGERQSRIRTDGLPTALWSLLLFIIGTTTYLLIPIRAAANPPINQGDPSNLERFLSYYKRDQYGLKPLIYGHTPYSQPLLLEERDSVTGEIYYHRYFLQEDKEYTYPRELNMWFPRMTSRDEADIEFYEAWAGMTPDAMVRVKASQAADSTGHQMGKFNPETGRREMRDTYRPTYLQQARYLLGYQIGYMYMRYLLWNFGGRQNNLHSTGGAETGNFITGIPAVDNAMLGDQKRLNNKGNVGHNRYFFIPFIFGIIGICALLRNGRDGRRICAVIATFFLFTGLLIVVYLNQDPGEPRERDYSFLGSYMAYAIWIGCGMAATVRLILRLNANQRMRYLLQGVSLLICLGIPLQMLSQTFDDHNRSHNTHRAEHQVNKLLVPVEKNAIVIVNGDNLIFPLWYGQEVLGVRRDVTVVAEPYLATEWYRTQLSRPGEGAGPVEIGDPLPPGGSTIERAVNSIVELNGATRPVYRSDRHGKLERLR